MIIDLAFAGDIGIVDWAEAPDIKVKNRNKDISFFIRKEGSKKIK